MLKSVLEATGLGLPRTLGRAVLSLLWHRVRLRVRGLRFTERPAAAIPSAQLARIDVCRTVAEGLGHHSRAWVVDRGLHVRSVFEHNLAHQVSTVERGRTFCLRVSRTIARST